MNSTAISTLRRVGVGALASLGIIAATATAATAAPTGYDRCKPGRLCLFTEPDGQGFYASFKVGSPDLAIPISGYVFDNKARSVFNNGAGEIYYLYPDARYAGTPLPVGTVGPTNLPASIDGQVSSLKR